MTEEERKAAELAALEASAQESTKQTEDTKTTEEIDYEKEFTEAVENFDRAEKNREGYLKRKQATEGAEEKTGEAGDVQSQVEEALAKALPKFIPKLQSTLAEDTVEATLNDLAGGNEAKKKLIRFHFENSVGANGTIRERMENALLIADKKTIMKTQKEMAVALQNRQGLSNTGQQGNSTEGQQVKDNFFSPEQLASLKAKGWDDKKIQRLRDNLQRSK